MADVDRGHHERVRPHGEGERQSRHGSRPRQRDVRVGRRHQGRQGYGEWPGLEPEQLYEERDLDLTTDFRDVLGELVTRQLGNRNMTTVFPGYEQPKFRGSAGRLVSGNSDHARHSEPRPSGAVNAGLLRPFAKALGKIADKHNVDRMVRICCGYIFWGQSRFCASPCGA